MSAIIVIVFVHFTSPLDALVSSPHFARKKKQIFFCLVLLLLLCFFFVAVASLFVPMIEIFLRVFLVHSSGYILFLCNLCIYTFWFGGFSSCVYFSLSRSRSGFFIRLFHFIGKSMQIISIQCLADFPVSVMNYYSVYVLFFNSIRLNMEFVEMILLLVWSLRFVCYDWKESFAVVFLVALMKRDRRTREPPPKATASDLMSVKLIIFNGALLRIQFKMVWRTGREVQRRVKNAI